jgi:hypothetical protein
MSCAEVTIIDCETITVTSPIEPVVTIVEESFIVEISTVGTQGAIGTPREYYESVSKNLKSWDASLVYTSGDLATITYTDGFSTIVKTFNYTAGDLTSIVLSGDTPAGIDLIKTLGYTAGNLTSVTYS